MSGSSLEGRALSERVFGHRPEPSQQPGVNLSEADLTGANLEMPTWQMQIWRA